MSRKSREAWRRHLGARSAPVAARHLDAASSKGRPLVPARPTIYNGVRYPSAHEASVAEQLDWLLRGGLIAAVQRQYTIEIAPCNARGEPVAALVRRHRVDFCVTHGDGCHTLVEVKGYPTPAYQTLVKWIEHLWLPEHPDYRYVVISAGEAAAGKCLTNRNLRYWP